MALPLCKSDPLVDTLKDVFGANIVRVPEERIRPLTVLASDGSRTSFRGALAPALVGAEALDVPVDDSTMANVSGKRSSSVKLDLGLKILGGFLAALHIPSAGIEAQLEGAKQVSFSFQDVKRLYVDPTALGHQLSGRVVDRQNPAVSIFFGDDWTFLVVDSAITSRDFSINVEKAATQGFRVDVPTIQQIVSEANAGVQVQSTSGTDLVFKGDAYLTFAFTCVRLFLDADGRIDAMPPADDVPPLTRGRGAVAPGHVVRRTPDRVVLTAKPAMLDLEMPREPVHA